MNPAKMVTNGAGAIVGAAAAALIAGCVYSEGGYGGGYVAGDGYVTGGGGYVEISSDSDFYGPLGAYGQWADVGDYGRCWVPGGVGPDWQPYCDGDWVSTDDGWYWESDEPWGWATYHYGRWAFAPGFGWCWIPGTQWAPCWVSWWEGDGYIGWAPLGPRDRFEGGRFEGRRPRDRDFVFVEGRRFTDRVRPDNVVRNNATVISRSTSVTNLRVVNHVTINAGPHRENIERASGRTVRTVPANDVRRQREAPVLQRSNSAAGARHPAPQGARPSGERAVAPTVSRPVTPTTTIPTTTIPPTPPRRDTTPTRQRPSTTTPAPEVQSRPGRSQTPAPEEHRAPTTEEHRTVTRPPEGNSSTTRTTPTRPEVRGPAPTHVTQPAKPEAQPKEHAVPKGGDHTEEKGDKGDKGDHSRQQQSN